MIPNDEDFARVIDAMYASATSTRLHPRRDQRDGRAPDADA